MTDEEREKKLVELLDNIFLAFFALKNSQQILQDPKNSFELSCLKGILSVIFDEDDGEHWADTIERCDSNAIFAQKKLEITDCTIKLWKFFRKVGISDILRISKSSELIIRSQTVYEEIKNQIEKNDSNKTYYFNEFTCRWILQFPYSEN